MTETWWSDALRLVTFVFAALAFASCCGVLWRARRYHMTGYQVSRFVSLLIFVTAVMVTEYTKFGAHMNWHTWADLAGSVFAWYGASALIRVRARNDQPV